jgi:hypothetical protein
MRSACFLPLMLTVGLSVAIHMHMYSAESQLWKTVPVAPGLLGTTCLLTGDGDGDGKNDLVSFFATP